MSPSAVLCFQHGKGFSRSNIIRFRELYVSYPISATLSHQSVWCHVAELPGLNDELGLDVCGAGE
jgi:hypothetical protein